MKTEELMYEYARDAYKEHITRKKEIRDRSSFFFGLGTPVTISIASISLASANPSSYAKIIILCIAGLMFVASIVFFLLIFLASNQSSFSPSQLLSEMPSIIKPSDIEDFAKNRAFENKGAFEDTILIDDKIISEARTFIGLRFFSNVYSRLFNEYEKKLKEFKWFFALLSITLCLALLLLTISLAL